MNLPDDSLSGLITEFSSGTNVDLSKTYKRKERPKKNASERKVK
jgi:hypothetical protein